MKSTTIDELTRQARQKVLDESICKNCKHFVTEDVSNPFCANGDIMVMAGLNEFINVNPNFGCNKFEPKEEMTITNETEYNKVLSEIYTLVDSKPNTPERNRFDELSVLIEKYENDDI